MRTRPNFGDLDLSHRAITAPFCTICWRIKQSAKTIESLTAVTEATDPESR